MVGNVAITESAISLENAGNTSRHVTRADFKLCSQCLELLYTHDFHWSSISAVLRLIPKAASTEEAEIHLGTMVLPGRIPPVFNTVIGHIKLKTVAEHIYC